MLTSNLEAIKRVLAEEADAIRALVEHLDERFTTAVDWIVGCEGRVTSCFVSLAGAIPPRRCSSTGSRSAPMSSATATLRSIC